MTNPFFKAASLALIATALLGCGGDGAPAETAAETATAANTPAPPDSGEVAFEPAFPEEVSSEPLSASDTAQQQTHRHGDGAEHTHDEEAKTDHGHPH